MKKNLLIAITGGIGSGKSTVTNLIKENSFLTLSSDEIVSEIYKERKIKKLLRLLFPTAVTGRIKLTIDRAEIAKQVFADKEKHRQLTELITPIVMARIIAVYKAVGGVIFAEVPLLFECEFQKYFDKVIVVTREKEKRIESAMLRSHLTREQVESRINNQVDYDSLDLTPYTVIENNGTTDDLKEKVNQIINSL